MGTPDADWQLLMDDGWYVRKKPTRQRCAQGNTYISSPTDSPGLLFSPNAFSTHSLIKTFLSLPFNLNLTLALRLPGQSFPLNSNKASWFFHLAWRLCCLMHFFLSSFRSQVPEGQTLTLCPSQDSSPSMGGELILVFKTKQKVHLSLLSGVPQILTELCAWSRGSGGWKSRVTVLKKATNLNQNFMC